MFSRIKRHGIGMQGAALTCQFQCI
jgi:hypothetical protein